MNVQLHLYMSNTFINLTDMLFTNNDVRDSYLKKCIEYFGQEAFLL